MAPLTKPQLLGLEIATRGSSIASLLGSLFIVVTFICFTGCRTSKTRLIFYAPWANIITNIATLVSASAIPEAGANASPLCEVQAFLIQWFMLADPFWVFCMAFNVWYIFRYRCAAESKLLCLERWYILFAYGLPAIIPIAYLVHDHTSSYRIIGSATLWCWVREEFEWMRIVFFYAPMWILAAATMGIHLYVGIKVTKTKMELRRVMEESRKSMRMSGMQRAGLGTKGSGTMDDPFVSPRNSIAVTTTISHRSRNATPDNGHNSLTPSYSPQEIIGSCPGNASNVPRSPTPYSPSTSPRRLQPLAPLNPNSPHRYQPLAIGRYRATAYAVPLASGEFATLPSPRVPVFQPAEHAAHIQRQKETADIFSYFKVALLLFVALVVVWVPSSINRLHQIFSPEHPIYGLNLASALVLPMQGFWNALIYAEATWPECKSEFANLLSRIWGTTPEKKSSRKEANQSGKDRASVETKATELTSRAFPLPTNHF